MLNIINEWQLEDILTISSLPNINSQTAIELISNYYSLPELLESEDVIRISPYFKTPDIFAQGFEQFKSEAEDIIQNAEKHNIRIISFWDYDYPILLKEIEFPPIILYIKGDFSPNDSEKIAMVGTRHSTDYGKMAAEYFAEVFAQNGITIVSGMATGIDTYSHFAAIKNHGITYAVLAGGLDRISPSSAAANAEKIIESGGAIISTYKPGINPLPPYFLQRNRIISGMSSACLVVESAYKGGSLNTARNAFEQGRNVYAVPGKINSERSKGTNALIKKNIAAIAISPEDILKDLNLLEDSYSQKQAGKKQEILLTQTQSLILRNIDADPIHVDKIAELTGFDIPTLLTELLTMEFSGLIKQLPGKHYIKSRI